MLGHTVLEFSRVCSGQGVGSIVKAYAELSNSNVSKIIGMALG